MTPQERHLKSIAWATDRIMAASVRTYGLGTPANGEDEERLRRAAQRREFGPDRQEGSNANRAR